jgi:hypothetical protein
VTDPTVSYTVKEMLTMMDERADERHAETQRAIRGLAVRVDKLENDQYRRAGWTAGRDKLIAAAIGVTGILMGLPAILYYIGSH